MSKIYFIRHGQTDMNIHHMLQGRTNTHLNETGRTMAEGAHDFLQKAGIRPDVILVSPLDRVKETVEIATGQPRSAFIEDPLLIEFGFGVYEGVPAGTMDPEFHHSFFEEPEKCVMPAGAESYAHIIERARNFLDEVTTKYPREDPRTVLCGTHGGFLHAMLVAAQGKKLHDFWDVPVKNCAIFELIYDEPSKQTDRETYQVKQVFEGFGDSYSRK